MSKARIYLVSIDAEFDGAITSQVRLVRAKTAAAAISYTVKKHIQCKVLDVEDAAE